MFRLKDQEREELWDIDLIDAVRRARQNQCRMLKGWQIFCTDKVNGGFEAFNDIIHANGGKCFLYKGRLQMTVSKRALREDIPEESWGDDDGDTLFLISGDSPQEKKIWPEFKKMANAAKMEPKIVKPDWLLDIALRQRIWWNPEWEHES